MLSPLGYTVKVPWPFSHEVQGVFQAIVYITFEGPGGKRAQLTFFYRSLFFVV